MEHIVRAIKSEDGEWVLEVLGVPYGGPNGGKDVQGEYFAPDTDLWLDRISKRPIIYYHGLAETKSAEVIGEELGWERRADGVWFRVALDKTKAIAQRIWEDAQKGLARASSGAISHLVRRKPDGKLAVWPLAELSLLDASKTPVNQYAVAMPAAKAVYKQAGLVLPDGLNDSEADAKADATGPTGQSAEAVESGAVTATKSHSMEDDMTDDMLTADDIKRIAAEATAEAMKAQRERDEQKQEAEKELREQIEAAKEEAIKAAREEWEAEAAKSRRLPFNAEDAPVVGKFGELRKYDNLNAADTALVIGLANANSRYSGRKASDNAYKALAVKLEEAAKDKDSVGIMGYNALKAVANQNRLDVFDGNGALKANEVNYSTLASYGDDWVSVAYSQSIWESIRHDTVVADRLPAVEVPQGAESITIPLESNDPTFYKVAQVASDAATGGLSRPAPTVPSSRMGTANQSLTVSKMGARTRYSGELVEDSIIPWVSQLRMQLARAGAEQFEHVIIDGDTETANTTNINDIAGQPAGTEAFMLFDGFRKLALVTNTANATPIGALTVESYKDVLRLMGAAGKGAQDPNQVSFIIDPNTMWETMELDEIKTRDVFSAATLENGRIVGLWGYPIITSYSMHWGTRDATGYEYKANASGMLDLDTDANNTTGSILAVRWDQWLLGYKRRMTIEVTRHPEWDGSEVVALMRVGLVNRDNEASAIGYNVTVS